MRHSVWIGFDSREAAAFAVARRTMRRHAHPEVSIHGVVLADLIRRGLYCRPVELRPSLIDRPVLWDTISDAPMSTEHACARFLVPFLAKNHFVYQDELGDLALGGGWALFCDGDVLARSDLGAIFDSLDPSFAVYCVKHRHEPTTTTKMDGRPQTAYSRKNWSSVMIFNCEHPANEPVTRDAKLANTLPGRDLHRFCWLDDSEIGELTADWNHLVGTNGEMPQARIAHFTLGTPDMRGYETCEHSDEWRAELVAWALEER